MGLKKLEKRVGFIGAGQMAEALARGFISKGVVKASDMVATDPVKARRDVFESFSVKPVISNAEVLLTFLRTFVLFHTSRVAHHMSSQHKMGVQAVQVRMTTVYVISRWSRKRTSSF